MAKNHFSVERPYRLSPEEAVQSALSLAGSGVSDLFLMTTADYPFDTYLQIGEAVRAEMPPEIRLVANIGDFTEEQARQLKRAGFTGAYHILRLDEGRDTAISPERRLATLDAIKAAGLELYYCVEPIGPEHTYSQIADEMLRARDYGVEAMAVMRRVPVPGTPLEASGSISLYELARIAAVAELVTDPPRSMNVHEPNSVALLAGVNQLYAEYGANPRDEAAHTETGRGLNINSVKQMLADAGYTI
jgi:biotin synthase